MTDEPITVHHDEETVTTVEPNQTHDLPTGTPDLVTGNGETQLEVKEPLPAVTPTWDRERLGQPSKAKPMTKKPKKVIVPKKAPVAPVKKTKFATVQLRAFKAFLALGADEPANAVTLAELAKHAKISTNGMRRGIGPTNKDTIAAHEERYGYKCLLSRGMVKMVPNTESKVGAKTRTPDYRYHLTALGTKKAEELKEKGELKLSKPRAGV